MIKRFLRTLKLRIAILLGKKSNIKPLVDCPKAWYGNDYGGFYVHPTILHKDSIVYSMGIGEDVSFDRAIIQRHGCEVFAFDPTPKSIAWIKAQELPVGFHFNPYGIDAETGFVNFNLPKNTNHVSGSILSHNQVDKYNVVSVPMKCFADIISEMGHKHIDVLKMDIEGAEYRVMESILLTGVPINQILVEVHERFFTNGTAKTVELLSLLRNYGYEVFGVSDSLEEISFIKTSLVK